MTLEKFDRVVRVTVAQYLSKSDFFKTRKKNAIEISDLKISFTVNLHAGKEPNNTEILIHNLNEQSRAEFQAKPRFVRLEAGYAGDISTIAEGDLHWGVSYRSGTEWITKVQIGDGHRAYRHARLNKSYKAGVKSKDIMKDLAQSMGLKLPKNVGEAKEFLDQYVSGGAINGPSAEQITKITKKAGFGWSIQQGRLQILKPSETTSTEAFVISEETGMIGVPEVGPPQTPKTAPVVTVRSLLSPEISPGRKVSIQSSALRGVYRAETVTHTGDNREGDFTTEIEGKPL